jgi:hypothetical protein
MESFRNSKKKNCSRVAADQSSSIIAERGKEKKEKDTTCQPDASAEHAAASNAVITTCFSYVEGLGLV